MVQLKINKLKIENAGRCRALFNFAFCIFNCFAFVLLAGSGCTTRSKARADARFAYQAGQEQAFANVSEARRINIRFIGPVRHAEIIWADGLTLAQAIAAADYWDSRDPKVVMIIRQRERISVSPRDLLNGRDWPLEPGDTIEMHP
jgi:hypothetical protein